MTAYTCAGGAATLTVTEQEVEPTVELPRHSNIRIVILPARLRTDTFYGYSEKLFHSKGIRRTYAHLESSGHLGGPSRYRKCFTLIVVLLRLWRTSSYVSEMALSNRAHGVLKYLEEDIESEKTKRELEKTNHGIESRVKCFTGIGINLRQVQKCEYGTILCTLSRKTNLA